MSTEEQAMAAMADSVRSRLLSQGYSIGYAAFMGMFHNHLLDLLGEAIAHASQIEMEPGELDTLLARVNKVYTTLADQLELTEKDLIGFAGNLLSAAREGGE